MTQELYALIASKRFWAAISALVVVVLKQFFPDISEDVVNNIVMVLSAWIVGETLRPTTDKTTPPVTTVTQQSPTTTTIQETPPAGVFPPK